MHRLYRWVGLWLGCLGLLYLAGCARPLPPTFPLTEQQVPEAEKLWQTLTGVNIPARFEADFRLGWEILGSKGAVDAFLLVQQPAYIRFSALDPLGRPLYIAVADGLTFSLADNRQERVYQGKVDSKFWQAYVPAFLSPAQLPFLLCGLPYNPPVRMPDASQNSDQDGFWYSWHDDRQTWHQVLLDRAKGIMRRHLVYSQDQDLLLDLAYQDYSNVPGRQPWPQVLTITGSAVTGTITVHLSQALFLRDLLTESPFKLTVPPHFSREQVD
jgi:hypothetical protein